MSFCDSWPHDSAKKHDTAKHVVTSTLLYHIQMIKNNLYAFALIRNYWYAFVQ